MMGTVEVLVSVVDKTDSHLALRIQYVSHNKNEAKEVKLDSKVLMWNTRAAPP